MGVVEVLHFCCVYWESGGEGRGTTLSVGGCYGERGEGRRGGELR